ncbi:methyltransferase domain-containing protein [Vibrio parahaemolyticus]|nr:methyltransferase domain-containing protein [Vibrio parahaemolyticus]EGR1597797.1 methyltransferase domain-containing protein [Vibrio parahaemolyticus]EGR1761743.1 methyltransferase domain-containing protein [Vibrio parahaemolyticus]EGR3007715.1 methyltransferase domain-containing protein [Vibrio parahaemolyticus]EGR3145329.1 methyltransferase domain-containing protein [Vibrio parahaemolyticus]
MFLGVILRAKLYKYFYRFIFPYLPNTPLCRYFKWKAAIVLVGDEFHKVNLDKNREKLAKHFAHDTPLQEELSELVVWTKDAEIKVLDVGAGPVSKVGKCINGQPIVIVPVDPMAEKYRALLESLCLKPKFWTVPGMGETLSQQFEPNSFDLAHARNCLDHSLEPLKAIMEVLTVLKPGCYFYLNHYRNEGNAAKYYGLHQWNFDVVDNIFAITSRFGDVVNVNQAIEGVARIHSISVSNERLVVIIQKR